MQAASPAAGHGTPRAPSSYQTYSSKNGQLGVFEFAADTAELTFLCPGEGGDCSWGDEG